MVSLTASSASSGDARRRAYRLVGSYTRSINASSSPTSYNASPRCLFALYQYVSQLYASFQGVVPQMFQIVEVSRGLPGAVGHKGEG